MDALDAHRLYVVEVRHPVEVPGSERAHLQQWLTKRCGWDVRAPELAATGLKLVGGRLLPGPTGPASFLMYESASGERFTIYTAKADAETTQMRYTRRTATTARCSGPIAASAMWCPAASDRDRLTQVAQAGLRPDGENRRHEIAELRLRKWRQIGRVPIPTSKIWNQNIGASHYRTG